MKKLEIGQHRFTEIHVVDEPGPGNACHEYQVQDVKCGTVYGEVRFQNGPVKENGVNGCHHEDLLAIVIDRLEGFQSGEFRCNENREALYHIRWALDFLNDRTKDRQNRGVEGKNEQ